jgi:hypothetical protein
MVDSDARKAFRRCLYPLRNACLRASENNEIWRIYQIDRHKHYQIMNEYHGFFACSIHAHFVATLVALGILYEKDSDSYNLHELIKYAEEHKLIQTRVLDKQKIRLHKVSKIAHNLWKIRSKAFAHMDTKLSYETVLSKFPFTPKQLTQLILTAKRILKDIFYAFEKDDSGNFQIGARTDTLALLAVLKKAKRMKIKKPKPSGRPTFIDSMLRQAQQSNLIARNVK